MLVMPFTVYFPCSRGTWSRATERMPQGPDLGTVDVRLCCTDIVRHAARAPSCISSAEHAVAEPVQ